MVNLYRTAVACGRGYGKRSREYHPPCLQSHHNTNGNPVSGIVHVVVNITTRCQVRYTLRSVTILRYKAVSSSEHRLPVEYHTHDFGEKVLGISRVGCFLAILRGVSYVLVIGWDAFWHIYEG